MAKIVVFDSGLGSLSIIKAIQRISNSDIIYFADQQNFPYGNKSQAQLNSIITKSIKTLQAQFSPDVLVVASNTPSLMLNLPTNKVIGVKPPPKEAHKISKSKRIGILGTKSAIKSQGLSNYIKERKFLKPYKIFKINGSELVDLVESGKFISNKQYCKSRDSSGAVPRLDRGRTKTSCPVPRSATREGSAEYRSRPSAD